MQTTINQRFKLICDNLFNGNISEMSRQCNINRGTLRDIIGDRQSEPRHDAILNVVESPYNISAKWLVSGDGNMIEDALSAECHNIENEKLISIDECGDIKGAPYFDVDFIGGFNIMFNEQRTTPAYYIDYKPYNKEGVMWVNLTGKSMEPELNHGDLIAIKEATTPIEYLPYGEVYAIVTDDFRTVKRLSRSDKEGFVRLVPANKSEEYAPQDIPVNLIRKVFYVLGSIKNLT